MIIDARTMDDGAALDADLCIIGGGPAGLAMAHTFLGTGREVVLLEGGGREWDQDDQALFWGESVGRPYLPLDGSRQRYLGGNSHVWGGWCAPYREGALDPWPWIPDSGWPITAGEIAPYVERAARLIGLPDEGWDPDHWAGRLGVERLPLRQGVLDVYVELIKKTRFADTLGPAIDADPAVKLFLYANLAGIETDAEARRVTGITARTRADGRTLKVRARHYVMAMGGIENARQLLLANEVLPAGLGNRHDVVGRYFADHVSFHGGILQPVEPNLDLGLADRHRRSDVELISQLSLPLETARRERLLKANLMLRPAYDAAWEGRGMRSVRALRAAALRRELPPEGLGGHLANIAGNMSEVLGLGYRSWQAGMLPIDHVELLSSVAPAPNRDSRVMLGDSRDALGRRHVALDWRLSPIDKRSARFMLETFAAEAGAAGLGRVQITMNDDDDDFDEVFVEPACHHMCTTRMASDPTRGVVDANCRVHGMDNLYCAGSSVFSSAGDGSPTMMLLALALRLADHLEGQPA
jgi:choline dehydrogenase-like flavoprotein